MPKTGRKETPMPGELYYPLDEHKPHMRNSWYLTVQERFPVKRTYGEYDAYRIVRQLMGEKTPDKEWGLRCHLYVYNEKGYACGTEILTENAVKRICREIAKGDYSGRLKNSDYLENGIHGNTLIMKTSVGTKSFESCGNSLERYASGDRDGLFFEHRASNLVGNGEERTKHSFGIRYADQPEPFIYPGDRMHGFSSEGGIDQKKILRRLATGLKQISVRRSTSDPSKVSSLNKKPRCRLSGESGNIFNLISIASRALEKAGMRDKAKEMQETIFTEAEDYDHALRIIMRYVEAV